mgnify:CR=1 FL=1
MVLDGMQARRCKDACLAPATAKRLAIVLGKLDRILWTSEYATDRCSETFREAQRYCVHLITELSRRCQEQM